jgi:DNA-binding GntR family transcriptional regulator
MIKQRLLSQEVEPGTKLREEDLADQLGVSRTPVREAINKLEREGLVEIIPRYGTFVANISSEDVEEIYQMREALECLAMRLALPRFSKNKLFELARIHKECRLPLEKGDFDPFIKVDTTFHHLLVKLSKNKRLMRLMGNLNNQIRLGRLESFSVPGRAKKSLEEHQRIIQAMLEGNTEEAENLLRQHSRNAKDNILHFLKMKKRD